jgi:energy-coupling factor transporter ATP-binding protein EcfA2
VDQALRSNRGPGTVARLGAANTYSADSKHDDYIRSWVGRRVAEEIAMIKTIRFENFKAFKDFAVHLQQVNVLVGPNNAGKSTILHAIRVAAAAIKFGRRRNPALTAAGGDSIWGYKIPASLIPISLANIHTDYQEIETAVTLTLENGNRMRINFYDGVRCVMRLEERGPATRTTAQFRKNFPMEIACFPTLGPLKEEEELRDEDYVERWQNSRRAHRMFRNIWYRQRSRFDSFQALVEQTWPGMSISPPELQGFAPAHVVMFCREGRIDRELCWAGFGFQIWLQLLTHLLAASEATTVVVDEPEIYLHPDLQRRLFQLLRGSGQQVVLATHSVEMINEAEHDEVVLVNRGRRTARRVADIDGLQNALFSIGSGQNIHLARLSRGRKILFLEGGDYRLLKRFAARSGKRALAEEVNITVIPIGGFTQRQKIEDVAWTFEKVLKADIAIAALLDRDYRCDEEIEDLLNSVRGAVPNFYILDQKEIENYLLSPRAISRAVQERMRDRGISDARVAAVSSETLEDMLLKCTDDLRPDVHGQLIAHRMRFFSGRTPKDPATVVAEAVKRLDEEWKTLDRRLRIVPGKQVLSALNLELQRNVQVSVTPPQIIRLIAPAEIGPDLEVILGELDQFATR